MRRGVEEVLRRLLSTYYLTTALPLSSFYHKPGRKGNKIAELTKKEGKRGCVLYHHK